MKGSGCETGRELKPVTILNADAALERRSSTVVRTFSISASVHECRLLVCEVLLGQPQLQGTLLLGQQLYEADA